ncbi:MAG: NUDIX hydrolase [Steroidobacteraceae bacterium]|jgi:8-oxo-dGTP pyrophosphatase MutT (NUDIX family)|nr:NUDIX hydrolase [Steroidobacteraceae bacterium]
MDPAASETRQTSDRTFRPSVTVASVIERDGRFLMVEERIGERRVFNQPAGHLEAGESLVDAAVRETLEETACRFTPTAVVGLYLWHGSGGRPTFLRVAFAGEAGEPEAGRSLDADILGCQWLTRDELVARPQCLRSPLVIRCIDDYLAGHRHPLSLLASFEAASPLAPG